MTAILHHRPIVETPHIQAEQTVCWHGEEDTAVFAQGLAKALRSEPSLADSYLTLHGDLGAGKTTLVRHLLRALGVTGRIKSPTYAVVEPYEATDLAIWHFDFYRFSDPLEWEDAGFRDIFASRGLKLAEWPDKAAGLAPQADAAILLEVIDAQQRCATLRAFTARGQALLRALLT